MQTSSCFFLGCYSSACGRSKLMPNLCVKVWVGDGSDSLQASSQKSSEGASHQRSTHIIDPDQPVGTSLCYSSGKFDMIRLSVNSTGKISGPRWELKMHLSGQEELKIAIFSIKLDWIRIASYFSKKYMTRWGVQLCIQSLESHRW